MSRELNFGPYVDVEQGKTVEVVTYGNPTPEGMVLTLSNPRSTGCVGVRSGPQRLRGAIEMMSMGASRFDIARFGAEVFHPLPRRSDRIIIAGRVANKRCPSVGTILTTLRRFGFRAFLFFFAGNIYGLRP